uniref:Uncharacterized protein n=1 Tax=Arundo donax TaxID=35708 RepID=A0A0A9GD38_ARUDO
MNTLGGNLSLVSPRDAKWDGSLTLFPEQIARVSHCVSRIVLCKVTMGSGVLLTVTATCTVRSQTVLNLFTVI